MATAERAAARDSFSLVTGPLEAFCDRLDLRPKRLDSAAQRFALGFRIGRRRARSRRRPWAPVAPATSPKSEPPPATESGAAPSPAAPPSDASTRKEPRVPRRSEAAAVAERAARHRARSLRPRPVTSGHIRASTPSALHLSSRPFLIGRPASTRTRRLLHANCGAIHRMARPLRAVTGRSTVGGATDVPHVDRGDDEARSTSGEVERHDQPPSPQARRRDSRLHRSRASATLRCTRSRSGSAEALCGTREPALGGVPCR